MIKKFVKWCVKRWALGEINEAIDANRDKVDEAIAKTMRAIAKTEAVLMFLKSLKAKIEDGKIDDDEADAILDEGALLVEKVTE